MSELVWPIVDDMESAKDAAHYAAAWSGVLFGMNVLGGGLHLIPLTICAIFGVGAWRIWSGSQAWAIAVFSTCICEFILVLLLMPIMWGIVMPFAFLALMNGVRATTAMERLTIQAENEGLSGRMVKSDH